MVKIIDVLPHSRAARAGILPGDLLLSINGEEIFDVLDYRFYLAEVAVTLLCKRGTEILSFTINKQEYDDIGLCFETPLMDEKHRCRNACIFCFIDQLPKGMRETLYFKDDDSRLSFLHGNYITMTNLTEHDVSRIIRMRFSPVRVSIHTTDPDLRVFMMKNKHAGEVLSYLDRFAEAGLTIHGQIVLCRGVNDGAHLTRSLTDLYRLVPALESLSVVPAGLTDHREGLYPLSHFTKQECRAVIETVRRFGDQCKQEKGMRVFYASDEFYLRAELPMPDASYYEEYSQIENGVGMLRSLDDEAGAYLALPPYEDIAARHVTLVTGKAAYGEIQSLADRVTAVYPQITCDVVAIENRFFGSHITVAGLLTGKDIAEQLKGRELGDAVLLPASTLRSEGDLFLCGMTPRALEDTLGVPLVFVQNDGAALVDAILGIE